MLRARPGGAARAQLDLGQPPGDIAILSFADSDLAGLAAAWAMERDALLAYQDGPFAALVVGAGLAEAREPKRGTLVLALLAVAGGVQIAHFLEASSAVVAGPYDLSLGEGSITPAGDVWYDRNNIGVAGVRSTVAALLLAEPISAPPW